MVRSDADVGIISPLYENVSRLVVANVLERWRGGGVGDFTPHDGDADGHGARDGDQG